MAASDLSAEQRIEREVEFLAGVFTEVRDLPTWRLASLADDHAEAARGYADAARGLTGRAQMTMLWLSGHHALKAQIYGAAS